MDEETRENAMARMFSNRELEALIDRTIEIVAKMLVERLEKSVTV